jgi:hypothetical protein
LYLRSPSLADLPQLASNPRARDAYAQLKRTGDGRRFLAQLRPLGMQWYDGELLAVAPYIKTHRASIRRELPFWSPPYVPNDNIFGAAHRAMMRRELFEALGDPAQAAAWHVVYRRFAEVFEDRDRLIALILLES